MGEKKKKREKKPPLLEARQWEVCRRIQERNEALLLAFMDVNDKLPLAKRERDRNIEAVLRINRSWMVLCLKLAGISLEAFNAYLKDCKQVDS